MYNFRNSTLRERNLDNIKFYLFASIFYNSFFSSKGLFSKNILLAQQQSFRNMVGWFFRDFTAL